MLHTPQSLNPIATCDPRRNAEIAFSKLGIANSIDDVRRGDGRGGLTAETTDALSSSSTETSRSEGSVGGHAGGVAGAIRGRGVGSEDITTKPSRLRLWITRRQALNRRLWATLFPRAGAHTATGSASLQHNTPPRVGCFVYMKIRKHCFS